MASKCVVFSTWLILQSSKMASGAPFAETDIPISGVSPEVFSVTRVMESKSWLKGYSLINFSSNSVVRSIFLWVLFIAFSIGSIELFCEALCAVFNKFVNKSCRSKK